MLSSNQGIAIDLVNGGMQSSQATAREPMVEPEIRSPAFHLAHLRSERARVRSLFGVSAALLLLVLFRAGISLAEGYRGETWRFAVLLAGMAAYQVWWLRFVERAIQESREVPDKVWTATLFFESLLPTCALLLQVHTSLVGPQRALTSPVVLAYFLFIILSTLHLNPSLSRLAGVFSSAGYVIACVYTFALFPEVLSSNALLMYATTITSAALLLLGGIAAGVVARQIRSHVIAALREAENRAKIAQLEHDLGIARSIQQGLLPKAPPAVDGFDIAGWNKPADETGGDYFDWQQLPDGKVAVTVADVTGHGIGSALCMAACRSYARAGFVTEPDLHSFLNKMNHLLYQDLPAEKFVTLAAGLLNPSEATLHLISAGHGPLLFYSSAENRFYAYDAQGVPLGLLPRAIYRGPQELMFNPGDILVVVTDGFVEWVNANDEDFGEDRIKEVVRANRNMPADGIIAELYSSVLKFADRSPQLDDLTALVVKRT